MANKLALSIIAQNIIEGNSTVRRVIHKIPEYKEVVEGYESVSVAFTGTSTNTVEANVANIDVNGAPFEHPITGAEVEFSEINGFCIVARRAATGTAPTGVPDVTVSGFGGWLSDGNIQLAEDAVLLYNCAAPATTSSATGITVDLTSTTGWRVDVLVWYTPA